MSNISGICITNRFHPRLTEAIKSVDNLVTEIIIIDTGLDNEAKERLESFEKVKIIKLGKPFTFAEQIREEVKQYAKNDYILYFDHDEIISPGLKQFILENIDKYDYFSIPRKNIIFGKWIQHSRWWPDYQIRLLKKTSVHWAEDIYIHVQPELKGNGCTIEAKEELAMIHYNYENIDEYFQKIIFYSKAEANDLILQNKDYTLRHAMKNALSEFISRFFTNEGYKDGTHGFVLATLQMVYYYFVYFYYWEKKKYFEVKEETLVADSRLLFYNGLFETNFWLMKKNLINGSKKMKYKIQNKILTFFK